MYKKGFEERSVSPCTVHRETTLFGRRYRAGQETHVVFVLDHPTEHEWLEEHSGQRGPWGWGGSPGA